MKTLTRRQVLQGAAAVVGGAAFASLQPVSGPTLAKTGKGARPPDIVVILTDQERHHVHLPDGFIDRTAPSWARLAEHGLTYRRAFTASAMCSPARASLLTGVYPSEHEVPYLAYPSPVLPTVAQLPNIASVLRAVGYEVVWKGKWHLSFPLDFEGGPPGSEVWTEDDALALESRYEMAAWNPPEAGNAAFDSEASRRTFGGGTADNDGRFTHGVNSDAQTPGVGESVVEFLDRVGATPVDERKPYCLFVSLVNPHDVTFYPNGWEAGGYDLAAFEALDIELPPSADDPLTTKPSIQTAFRTALEQDGPLPSDEERRRFVRFYAYLHGVVDGHVGEVLDALDRNGLTEDAVIFRTADHGEMGLAHGLREKSYNVYEETIHIPLVISNPRLFPEPVSTDALYSHVDLLPTIAELAGAEAPGVGMSQVQILTGAARSVQDGVLFTFDDKFLLDIEEPLSHIRALRTARWTYAVYYSTDGSAFEYELYDNDADPDQLENRLAAPSPQVRDRWLQLHGQLSELMVAKRATPDGFDWSLAQPAMVSD